MVKLIFLANIALVFIILICCFSVQEICIIDIINVINIINVCVETMIHFVPWFFEWKVQHNNIYLNIIVYLLNFYFYIINDFTVRFVQYNVPLLNTIIKHYSIEY